MQTSVREIFEVCTNLKTNNITHFQKQSIENTFIGKSIKICGEVMEVDTYKIELKSNVFQNSWVREVDTPSLDIVVYIDFKCHFTAINKELIFSIQKGDLLDIVGSIIKISFGGVYLSYDIECQNVQKIANSWLDLEYFGLVQNEDPFKQEREQKLKDQKRFLEKISRKEEIDKAIVDVGLTFFGIAYIAYYTVIGIIILGIILLFLKFC